MEDGLHVLPESHASHSRCYFTYPYKQAPTVTCTKFSATPIIAPASTWCTSEMIEESYGTAGPVTPEQAEYALRSAKLNATQLPG